MPTLKRSNLLENNINNRLIEISEIINTGIKDISSFHKKAKINISNLLRLEKTDTTVIQKEAENIGKLAASVDTGFSTLISGIDFLGLRLEKSLDKLYERLTPVVTSKDKPESKILYDAYEAPIKTIEKITVVEKEAEETAASPVKINRKSLAVVELEKQTSILQALLDQQSRSTSISATELDMQKDAKLNAVQAERNKNSIELERNKTFSNFASSILTLIGSIGSELSGIGKANKDPVTSLIGRIVNGTTGAIGKYIALRTVGKAVGSVKNIPSLSKGVGAVSKVGKSIPVLSGLISGGVEYLESGNASRSVAVGGGSLVGGVAGAKTGAALGTMIAPGVGTVVGGIAGGIIGSIAGEKMGRVMSDWTDDFSSVTNKFSDTFYSILKNWSSWFKETFEGIKLWFKETMPSVFDKPNQEIASGTDISKVLEASFDKDLAENIKKLIMTEGGKDSTINRSSGAAGFYQFMPSTAKDLAKKLNIQEINDADIKDVPTIVSNLPADTQTKMYKEFISELLKVKPNPSFADLKATGFAPGRYVPALKSNNMSATMYNKNLGGVEANAFSTNPEFQKWDVNEDGVLTAEELKNGAESMEKQKFGSEFVKIPKRIETPPTKLEPKLDKEASLRSPAPKQIMPVIQESMKLTTMSHNNALAKSMPQIIVAPQIQQVASGGNNSGPDNSFGGIRSSRSQDSTFEKATWNNTQLSLLRLV